MSEEAIESFREKAPLVSLDELAEIITKDILTEELRQKTESVWLFNSFVDPEREIDEKETDSDLDVILLVPDWELPVLDTGLAVVAPQADTPEAYENNAGEMNWSSKDGKWDSPAKAWERLPDYVRETFLESVQRGFFANESDVESNNIRLYDITIVNRTQFHYDEEATRICIWENDALKDNGR